MTVTAKATEAAAAMGERPVFLLKLRAEPGEGTATSRLRRLLKSMLRSFQFRCLAAWQANGADMGEVESGGGI
jgi:hypothetical protein